MCDVLQDALVGPLRREMVEEAMAFEDIGRALRRLRSAMAAHAFQTRSSRLDLAAMVRKLDLRTRRDGFRILHSWNFRTHAFTEENTPVLMLDYFADIGVVRGSEREALAILLDHYFLQVLSLLALRAWDEGRAGAVLDRIGGLIEHLQGPKGSGHRFVAYVETLLILGISQFHPEEKAYDRLIEKAWTLDEKRRLDFARLSTAVLGSHLRWGFGVMYRRDLVRMRADNTGDYPWLLTSLGTLMRAYAGMQQEGAEGRERDEIVEGLMNGLSPDPWAFFGDVPAALAGYEAEHREFAELFGSHRESLLADFVRLRPDTTVYSPIHLHFNFPHTALVSKVLIALHRGSDQNLPVDALLVGDRTAEGAEPARLARTLMDYSRVNPQGFDAHGAMLVVHDPQAGLRHYNMALHAIRKHFGGGAFDPAG
jgi:hypothetical protein